MIGSACHVTITFKLNPSNHTSLLVFVHCTHFHTAQVQHLHCISWRFPFLFERYWRNLIAGQTTGPLASWKFPGRQTQRTLDLGNLSWRLPFTGKSKKIQEAASTQKWPLSIQPSLMGISAGEAILWVTNDQEYSGLQRVTIFHPLIFGAAC
jgi:hypothetical protein